MLLSLPVLSLLLSSPGLLSSFLFSVSDLLVGPPPGFASAVLLLDYVLGVAATPAVPVVAPHLSFAVVVSSTPLYVSSAPAPFIYAPRFPHAAVRLLLPVFLFVFRMRQLRLLLPVFLRVFCILQLRLLLPVFRMLRLWLILSLLASAPADLLVVGSLDAVPRSPVAAIPAFVLVACRPDFHRML